MNSFFRHYSIRLWGTAFLGTMIGLLVLPWWQHAWGVHWLMAPVLVMTVAIFIGLGWVMNRCGNLFLMRQLKEATVYERAGLIAETRHAFEQAAALFDSFWLSPAKRKSANFRASSRVARFFLSRPVLDAHSRLILAAHLKRYPHDDIVAESWLSRLISIQDIFPEEYDAATSAGEALHDHPDIQWGLFRFYLKDIRADFNALKTYQRVWQRKPSLPEAMLFRLARLLLDNLMLNDWCLAIYLQAYKAGESSCIEGIGAAVRWLPETVDNAPSLALAKDLIADLPKERLARLTRRFEKYSEMTVPSTVRTRRMAADRSIVTTRIRVLLSAWVLSCRKTIDAFGGMVRGTLVFWRHSVRFQKYVMGCALCLLVVWVGILVRALMPNAPEETAPRETPTAIEPSIPTITDPFTIQVAAYLNPDDAKEYVRRLKEKGLDVYWTQATSAKRVWYQVKVSHFPTKAQAQQYGDQLKSKGLIDDFYVANYQRNK